MKDVVELYLETKDFEKAIKESGMTALAAHIRLLSSGVLSIDDKIEYGSYNQMRGAKAEELFKKLVPNSISANDFIRKNNPVFDFMVGNLTIDIKYSSLFTTRNDGEWSVKFTSHKNQKHADLYVVFLEREKESFLDNPIILVIPGAFITHPHKTIGKKSNILTQYQVTDDELAGVIEDFSKIKNK